MSIIFIAILFEPKIKINSLATFDHNRLVDINKTLEIYDDNNKIINNKIYDNNKIFTSLDEMSPYIKNAFIAIEDKRFYSHHGVDYLRILSASIKNLASLSFKEGASTITQQLVKNTHLSNQKTIKRKINEIRIAKEIERIYSKDEILEFYLNILYFGNNIYGIGTACQIYFDKKPKNITLAQSALLAGIINNPTKYNPFTNIDNAINRMKIILNQMFQQGLISDQEFTNALNEKIEICNKTNNTNHYINAVINQAQEILDIDKQELFDNKYKIYTYYIPRINDILENSITTIDQNKIISKIIILDNKTGKVLGDFSNSKKNTSNLLRQSGSTIKPIICYAKALEDNKISPITPILDEKTNFNGYTPSNFNNKYYGWTNCQDSLKYSLNIPAVKLLEMNGIENSISFGEKFGIHFDKKDNNLSIALGGMTKGVSLLNLTNAYLTFANNGEFIKSSYIKEIRDKDNNIIYSDKTIKSQIIREDTAYFINKMLSECAKTGTGKKLASLNQIIACKTGTVGTKSGNSDAYCIAYNKNYTIGVWLGAKDNNLMANNITGGNKCTEIIKNILSTKLFISKKFDKPSSIITLPIDLYEYKNNHKVLLADDSIAPIDKINIEFSVFNYPKQYSHPHNFIYDDILNFDNFQIINSFLN